MNMGERPIDSEDSAASGSSEPAGKRSALLSPSRLRRGKRSADETRVGVRSLKQDHAALRAARHTLDAARKPASKRTAESQLPANRERLRRELADVCRLMLSHAAGCHPIVTDRPPAAPAASATDAAPPDTRSRASNPVELAAPTDQPALPRLSPRVRQTLDRLLKGDSEKQIARHLNVSPHTVHVYVKTLYKRLQVNSRGELLALFVRPLTAAVRFE